jgi:hypothetical protein
MRSGKALRELEKFILPILEVADLCRDNISLAITEYPCTPSTD